MFRWASLRRRQQLIAELLSRRASAPDIRACTAEEFLLDDYRDFASAVESEQRSVEITRSRKAQLGRALTGFGMLITYTALGLLLHAGAVPLPDAGAAVLAIQMGTASLGRLAITFNKLYEQGLYVGDYEAFIKDTSERRPRDPVRSPPKPFRQLSLTGVGFTYPGADQPALADLTLTVRRGEVVALVGENGSGKSTFAKVLAGLYRPDRGVISWDDTDLADVDPRSVRKNVA
jgi:ABC-type bacteriocin/lantibiotic exporter with double-glycine peptidase domain